MKKATVSSSTRLCGTNLTTLRSQSKARELNNVLEKNIWAVVQLEMSLGKHCRTLIFLKAGDRISGAQAQCR